MFRRFIRRAGWGTTPGGRGFFSHRGPHMPHGGGGGLFRVLTLPLKVAASLLRLAALLKHNKRKGVHRGHHARVKKGRKPKIQRGPHPHGVKRPIRPDIGRARTGSRARFAGTRRGRTPRVSAGAKAVRTAIRRTTLAWDTARGRTQEVS